MSTKPKRTKSTGKRRTKAAPPVPSSPAPAVEAQPRRNVDTTAQAMALAEAANHVGTAANAYFQNVCIGGAPLDPRVLAAAHAVRCQANRVIRHHEGAMPRIDGDDDLDLGSKLTRIADVLEQLADNPPSSASLYRMAVIGLALSRIETLAMRILSSPVQGEG